MSLCKVFAEFQFILVMRFKKQFAERVKTENFLCLLSLFIKSTKLSCYYECIQIKVDPLQIWMVYCSYLYDQKCNSSSFRPYQESLPQNAYPRTSTSWLMANNVFYSNNSNWKVQDDWHISQFINITLHYKLCKIFFWSTNSRSFEAISRLIAHLYK